MSRNEGRIATIIACNPRSPGGSVWVARLRFFLVFLEVRQGNSYQEYPMKEHDDCTRGVCPGASAHGETVQVYVAHNHPLLQLKRALPWEALCEVMTRHWRQAGKNTDGRPGLSWDVALYVPLVVLMLVKNLNSREMEAYVAENVVARVFISRTDDPRAQLRDHSNIARAYVALGQDGVNAVNALILHVAKDFGFADPRILSSDTTAQELPIGYPNEPGILRGWAQRCGRALVKLKTRGVWGSRRRPSAGADDPQIGQRTSSLCQGQGCKASGVGPPAEGSRAAGRGDPAPRGTPGAKPRSC